MGTDWQSEADRLRSDLPVQLSMIAEDVAAQLSRGKDERLPEALIGADGVLARVAVLGDGPSLDQAAAVIEPHLSRAIAATETGAGPAGLPLVTTGIVNLIAVLRCAGRRDDPADQERILLLLDRVASDQRGLLRVETARRACLTALAFGRPDQARALWSTTEKAGRLTRKPVAAPIGELATADDITAAWRDLLGAFPALLDDRLMTWGELVVAGRAVHHVHGGIPEGRVVAAIRAELP
ncbi:hypothetical protein [Paractinoplanes globisporus]|uniref:Uncharacterized protein n=1 Tax=Paractinoplanes globisporus TaxID=113565 RepID=A0ABW6W9M1_9ACTN|nr:hypothetical protein [Actinoplanes globisporus]